MDENQSNSVVLSLLYLRLKNGEYFQHLDYTKKLSEGLSGVVNPAIFTGPPLNKKITHTHLYTYIYIYIYPRSLSSTNDFFSTSKTNFIFDGVIYDQIDGIDMGSPLAPTLANLFMGYNEGKWLSEFGWGGLNFIRAMLMTYLRFLKTKARHSYFCII